ncbi:MAG TPA: hypothetical protein VK530_13930 [Candidatus Acidoferrum sp.]|nr:hypothetical protein [Candidatus Acidoferrum sp.]
MGETKRLWQFTFRGDNPQLTREETKLQSEPLPPKLFSKDWQSLYQPRLNIAWLPADRVFLRVIQLPPADTLDETLSMLDLQLEKLSPLPTAQIVWTFELLPNKAEGTQTAVVVIAARNHVEEFLGKLEGQSYLADRLEVPFIDQLLALRADSDGVWIYPGAGADENTCVVTWWFGGVLQNISLLHLPGAEERGAFVREQLAQMAWAGELEGWLTGPMQRFLVADEKTAEMWRPLLETPEQPLQVVPPIPEVDIASSTARRAARDGVRPPLLPPEYTARYKQKFQERIGMRLIGALIVLYLLFAVVYIGALEWRKTKVAGYESQKRGLEGAYTNALQLKARVRVMEDQLNLQFAALRCYKAVAENLPDGLTLDSMSFQRGRSVLVFGSGDSGAQAVVNEFNDKLRKHTVENELLFSRVNVPNIRSATTAAGPTLSWNFQCDLKNAENE